MKTTLRRAAPALLLAIVAAASACSHKTYVEVTIASGGALPAIGSIELQMTLGTLSASTTLTEPGSKPITLPTSVVLELKSGEGSLSIVAIAKDASGTELIRGTTATTVSRGGTAHATVTLGTANTNNDLGGGAGLKATPTEVMFGSVLVGSTGMSGTVSVTNEGAANSGNLNVAASGAGFTITDDTCTGNALASSASCTFRVAFAPSATGASTGTATITAPNVSGASVALSGTGLQPGALSLDKDTQDFGAVVQNTTSAAKTFTVTNTGGTQSGTITATLTGTDAARFAISADGCSGTKLNASATCTIDVTFTPNALGVVSGVSLTVEDGTSGGDAATLSGTGVAAGALGIGGDPAFGVVDLPGKLARDFTVTNNGGSPIGPLTVTSDDPTQFAVDATTTCSGATLPAGLSCTQRVTFQPSSYGSKAAVLSVGPASGPGGTLANLSGTGRDTVQLQVNVGGTGTGVVTGGTINCGNGNTMCTVNVQRTTSAPSVTLTETPNLKNSGFGGWGGDCSGSATTCNVSMTTARTVSATFNTATTVSLTVTPSSFLSATGTVTSGEGFINCGATCSSTYAQAAGATVILTATPGAKMAVVWGGDCAAQKSNPTCTLTMNANHNVTAKWRPYTNIMFVSSASYDGNLGGVTGGDSKCQGLADTAGLPGTYKAWLADEAGNKTPTARLQSFNSTVRGWIRRDGAAFGDYPANLYTSVSNPPIIDETGATVNTSFYAVKTGVWAGAIYAAHTCSSWTTTTGDVLNGNLNGTDSTWTSYQSVTTGCSSLNHIYCFGVDYSNAP